MADEYNKELNEFSNSEISEFNAVVNEYQPDCIAGEQTEKKTSAAANRVRCTISAVAAAALIAGGTVNLSEQSISDETSIVAAVAEETAMPSASPAPDLKDKEQETKKTYSPIATINPYATIAPSFTPKPSAAPTPVPTPEPRRTEAAVSPEPAETDKPTATVNADVFEVPQVCRYLMVIDEEFKNYKRGDSDNYTELTKGSTFEVDIICEYTDEQIEPESQSYETIFNGIAEIVESEQDNVSIRLSEMYLETEDGERIELKKGVKSITREFLKEKGRVKIVRRYICE